ncbi:MAG: DUF2141 domain-containing protein [Desulfobacteraceae bacterium]|jgi:uncharacterized protein (DUF2141 family)
MYKKAIFFLGVLLMASAFAYAEDKFTVSGEVTFPKRKGEIHVELKTQEEYEKGKQVPEDRRMMIKLSAQQLKSKKASFEFVNVPAGDYLITCFQDLNKNGKIDFSISSFGEHIGDEPWGCYRPLGWPSSWDTSKFKVDKNIAGIKIDLKKGRVE